MAGVLQSANEAKLASMAGAYNLGITNLDDDNEPAFTGVVEVNGAYFKFTGEAPTGIGSVSGIYYISVVVNTGVTPNTATLECEATTGYTADQTKNGIYDATGAKRAVLQCTKTGNNYYNKIPLRSAEDYDRRIYTTAYGKEVVGVLDSTSFSTSGDLYTALAPFLDDSNRTMVCSGVFSYFSGSQYYYFHFNRITKQGTDITIYGILIGWTNGGGLFAPGTVQTFVFSSGSSTAWTSGKITVAW